MAIFDFYKSVLGTAGAYVDRHDQVNLTFGGDSSIPFTVEGKRLVLPTREHMTADQSEMVLFHPLKENILAGESKVMSKFRDAVNTNLNVVLNKLLGNMVAIGAQQRTHDRVTPDQLEVLKIFKDADKNTVDFFERLDTALAKHEDKGFIHIFVKKKATLKGKAYRRAAIISFPLYEEIVKSMGGTTLLGVKFRKKDIALFKLLLETVFPGLDTPDHYSRGDESGIAPTLDALMRGVLAVAEHINDLAALFTPLEKAFEDCLIPSEWLDDLGNLEQFEAEMRLIPMQAGNDGGGEKVQSQAQAPVRIAPAQPSMQMHPGTAAQSGGLDFQAYQRTRNQQFQAPVQQFQPVMVQQQPGYWGAAAAPQLQPVMSMAEQIRATGRPAWEVVPNNYTNTAAPAFGQQMLAGGRVF